GRSQQSLVGTDDLRRAHVHFDRVVAVDLPRRRDGDHRAGLLSDRGWTRLRAGSENTAGGRMNDALLRLDNLSVAYRTSRGDVQAVQNVTLNVPKGQTVGLVGESGSGKSTVAAAILRLLPNNAGITSGSIE